MLWRNSNSKYGPRKKSAGLVCMMVLIVPVTRYSRLQACPGLAAERLGDVEAMLKKVELGITEFDGPMENHCLASQPNRREKYGNMKTSMKELQRDRTQLSTWISALTDARSKIEARMMKFKTFSVTC